MRACRTGWLSRTTLWAWARPPCRNPFVPSEGVMEPRRSIIDYLADQAQRSPARPLLYYRDGQLAVHQVEAQTAKCRGALRALGVGSGDRVALVMSDCPDMVVAMLGVMGLGALAVPCSTMLRPAELAYILNDSGARCAIVTPDQLDNVLPARPQSP